EADLSIYRERGWEQSSRARAGAYLDGLWRASGTPAISTAVIRNGELVFSEAIGYADLEHLAPATTATVYNIGSVSKAITAVAVMQLVERGAVDLDDPIQKYVPAFPEKRWPVTVRHLLTHTSGVRHYGESDFPDESDFDMNWKPYASLAEAITIFAADPLLFEPGTFYRYTSYGANLLQGVVETGSGMGFEEYLRRRVWQPAGMLQTALDVTGRIVPHRARGYLVDGSDIRHHPWEELSYKWAGGGMISTAEDLVRLGAALLDGRLMRPETVELMFTPQLGNDVLYYRGDDPPEPLRWQQALIWRIRQDEAGRDYVNHCGSVEGFNACLILYVEERLVAATADNADSSGLRPSRALADFFRRSDDAPTASD
ncbi:MAG: serine hydrolase domain-containing protein, partial [Thermoanaerobaculia bacterium]|nr:serine hydrolase domain-containing protein [Thermoanaerobaculia bacterium]